MHLLLEEKESEPWEGKMGWLYGESSKGDVSILIF
jgi:hypothetical protein